jgi:hypothetical protein
MDTAVFDDCENIFHQALSSESESAFCHAVNPLFKRIRDPVPPVRSRQHVLACQTDKERDLFKYF